MSQPLPPSQITALAKRLGQALTQSHNAYQSIYPEAYGSGHSKDAVPNAVTNEGKEKLRLALDSFSQTLMHVTSLIEARQKEFKKVWSEPLVRRICNHCDERQALPYSTYCSFCHTWARQHAGNLPSDAVLAEKEVKRNTYGKDAGQ